MKELNDNQKEIINKIFDAIQAEATYVRENKDLSNIEKLEQVDILLDVQHFLKDYTKNVEILNKYKSDHRFDREK